MKLLLQENYGAYIVIGMNGKNKDREQFFNIISNNCDSKIKQIPLGESFSYFLLHSIKQFEEILTNARLGILQMRSGYEILDGMEENARRVARNIVRKLEISKFLAPSEEASLHFYESIVNNIDG